MSRNPRTLAVGLIALAAFFALLGIYAPGRQAAARAAAPAASRVLALPDATCNFTVLNFNIGGTGSVEVTRTVAITAGDTFEQFIAPPITATASSSAYAILNSGFAGTATGGITGTFTLTNINGMLVTNPEGLANPRGFLLHNIVINGASGTITAAMAINFIALTTSPPYYPRAFNGYLHSIATSGSYATYRYNGAIAGTILQNFNGSLQITATVTGRLYTGGGTLNEAIAGVRSAPPNRGLQFQPSDIIAQFRSPDFSVGSTSAGHITPRTSFVGTTVGTINGGFVMDHDTLSVDAGSHSGKGWLAGEFTFSDTGGNILTGPWLSDENVSGGTSVVGYVWQVIGTGIYTDSLLFGTVVTSIYGNTTLAGTISGVYCDGSVIPTATPLVSTTPTATGQPTRTATMAATVAASATSTFVNTGTSTGTPALTGTPTATGTASTTSTSVPATATVSATRTATVVVTTTGTPCAISFTDVQPTDYFYEPVRYLYCRGAISGYGDNTFRPYNNTTRGQLSKIVVLAEGWQIATPTGTPTFRDVPADSAFYAYVETAYSHNIISGYSCGSGCLEFRPNNNVTRAQLTKIIVLAQNWAVAPPSTPTFNDVPATDAFYGYIETAYSHNIISGYGCGSPGEPCPGLYFRPTASATRGQIAKIVYNAVTAP